MSVIVRFWGVRGSFPVADPAMAGFGGDTACVEVEAEGRRIVFDAGTGLRALGQALAEDPAPRLDLLLSHYHLDHVMGLTGFAALWRPETQLRLWTPRLGGAQESDPVGQLFAPPFFPVSLEATPALIERRWFTPGRSIDLSGGVKLRTQRLAHPGGSTGFRLEAAGKVVAYLTDVELGADAPNPALVGFAADADLLICDAMFGDADISRHRGWGHSSARQAAALAAAARARRLALFHHAPSANDAMLGARAAEAAAAGEAVMLARQGQAIVL